MRRSLGTVSFALYSAIVVIPITLALIRLISVTGFNPTGWFASLSENYVSLGVTNFTVVQATASTFATLVISMPIAWVLGRYKWNNEPIIRSILTLPFVVPSIIAAMGILTIVGSHGLNIRSDESTWWWTLVISHAWFNMALFIRFCEPLLSSMNPELEEQLRLLPHGRTRLSRIRNLWLPLLMPPIVAAACMTFVFSFTSFALVKWITVGNNTLESMMADVSSSAGIAGYMESSSNIVMGASLIQFTILLTSLWLTSVIQRKQSYALDFSRSHHSKKIDRRGLIVLIPALIFALLPLISVLIGSFRIRNLNPNTGDFSWGTGGWEAAIEGGFSFAPVAHAFGNSLGYAFLTLIVALPLGYTMALTIYDLEKIKPRLGRLLDVFTMLPFALSAAMIGLGVLIGVIKINPSAAYKFWALPALAHVMLTTPFVVRIMLPAIRSYDKSYDENAKVMGMKSIERFFRIRLPLLKGSFVVSSVFVLAMSLGEFGASFVIARNTDWVTLPLLIDAWRGKPMKDPFAAPASNAIASVLLLMTMILFMIAEKFRNSREGGMF